MALDLLSASLLKTAAAFREATAAAHSAAPAATAPAKLPTNGAGARPADALRRGSPEMQDLLNEVKKRLGKG